MIDLKRLRKEPHFFRNTLKRRNAPDTIDIILELDDKFRTLQNEIQLLQTERNKAAESISKKKENLDSIRAQGEFLKEQLQEKKKLLEEIELDLNERLSEVPNILLDDVPDGTSDKDNAEIKKWGNIEKFDFKPKQHFELLNELMDFETASKVSGSRFVRRVWKSKQLEQLAISL